MREMAIDMRYPTEAEILQASAIIVAAPRYCGAFASVIGVDVLAYWPWFATAEIASGAAMAVLEGWTVAYMFRRFRTVRPLTTHWYILLSLQLLLMLALPATATPYLVSSQLKLPVAAILHPALLWLWSFTVAGIAPLVLAAVGYADVELAEHPASKRSQQASERIERAEQAQSDDEQALSALSAQQAPLSCPDCGASSNARGEPMLTPQALSAHKRFCAARVNGYDREVIG